MNLLPRSEIIQQSKQVLFDLIVIGGGIHGVCVAKMAAQSGLSVLLLEQGDFASGTSSRSSKMAHGGLRYLEMFDFEQVYEGIRSREDLFKYIPNLVKPERFLIPVPRRDLWFRFKLGIGLTIYDLMARSGKRRHRWLSGKASAFGDRTDLAGCYEYTDGLMSDSRLVFEFLTSARYFGAQSINYAEVESINYQGKDGVSVRWCDQLTQSKHESRARLVVNCAGPWAPHFSGAKADKIEGRLRYSRGSHLVFSVPWRHQSLFLPLDEKGRYYFVWPHQSGTMVGTTEREVSSLDRDPQPSQDEITEILERLKRDLPHAGLDRNSLCYAFAGVRSLPTRPGRTKGVGQLSRKHIWELNDNVLTLFGGKYTTFVWTAREGLKIALKKLGNSSTNLADPFFELPSAISEREQGELISFVQSKISVPDVALRRAVSRLGKQVLRYIDRPDAWQEINPGVLRLEVIHGIEIEQALYIEDLLRRRVELEATPNHGIETLDLLSVELAKNAEVSDLARQKSQYLTRMEELNRSLRATGA